jgi:adenosylcobyric acid synthase
VKRRLGATLMIQGTSSSAGKSFLVAGLCRVFARRGIAVAPFKAQNMALNAAVTVDGGEIGRAQAVQAQAARIPAEVVMNPVLLKGDGDMSCQVVFMGRPIARVTAGEYFGMRTKLWPGVRSALQSLRCRFDLVIIEGAGSPVELNLLRNDFVNMRVAHAAHAPVILVSDIERGGLFAAVLGTLDLLPLKDRALVKGIVVNRFRGDPALFEDGVEILQKRSGLPVLAVIPELDIRLPAEDALDLPRLNAPRADAVLDIAVVDLPHISNFDDLEPLLDEPGVSLRLVADPSGLGKPDLIVIPGTKTTVADLSRMRASGLADAIAAAARDGSAVLGICGGYQMMGEIVSDPAGVEGGGESPGLRLLPLRTIFESEKVTRRAAARVNRVPGLFAEAGDLEVAGYEIHMGRTVAAGQPPFSIDGQPEGCASRDGWVVGTGLHGLLLDSQFRLAMLLALARRKGARLPGSTPAPMDPFERLADALERAFDMRALEAIIWPAEKHPLPNPPP